MYRILSWTAVILWMIIIYNFSSQEAVNSNQLSTRITETIIQTVENISPNSEFKTENLNSFIRKNAHLVIYFVLGMLVINAFKRNGLLGYKSIILAVLISVLYAVSDEVHQIFVPGRGAQVSDVIIDSIGVILGSLLYIGIIGLKKQKIKRWD